MEHWIITGFIMERNRRLLSTRCWNNHGTKI